MELFFDLVFVAAVAELVHTFAGDLSIAGVITLVALFVPVWWARVGSTFYATRFDTDDLEYRLLTAAEMFAVIVPTSGESAGGNPAIAATIQLRDTDNPPLVHQLLAYPFTTLADPLMLNPNVGEPPYFGETETAVLGQLYLPYLQAALSALTSPLYYADTLRGLPSATVMTTGFDSLRYQGLACAKTLCGAGVDVRHGDYPRLMHDVLNMEHLPEPFLDVPQAAVMFDDAGQALRDAFEGSSTDT